MPRASTIFSRAFEPLLAARWTFFLVWTAILAVLWLSGEDWLGGIANPGLRAALVWVSRTADLIWLLIATANLYLHLAETEGLGKARLLALTIFLVSTLAGAITVRTGYPLGSIFYTTRLGPKLASVPLGWPLLWFVVVVSGRALAGRLMPHASHGTLALCTGIFAVLTDLSLEPVAIKVRLFWMWFVTGTPVAAPPLWRNYASWFLFATAFAWLMRERRMASAARAPVLPALVLVVLHALLLLAHLRTSLSG